MDPLNAVLSASVLGVPVPLLAMLPMLPASVMFMVRDRQGSVPAVAVHGPGWIARRRARKGIRHRRDRIGVGYASATHAVHLTARELTHHGAVFGGPGSGKTTFLRLLIEAASERMPVVVVDPKGSPALADTVRSHGGVVWTIDGKTPADLLDPRPWQVPDLLLEAEDYSAEARAYRDAAHQRALWAAWSIALDNRPMDLAELRRRMDRDVLTRSLERHRGRDARIADWLEHLEHQHGGIEDSGARGLDRALGILLDGPAMRGSLRTCPEALRLEDVLDTRGLVLFSLDERTYPHATCKIAAWVLLAMGRLSRDLPASTDPRAPRALLLVDEIGALKSAARHLRPLVGRAREDGLAVVLATQGPSDLEAVDRALLPQVVQDTAWQLIFRQGTVDSSTASRILGVRPDVEQVRDSRGYVSERQVQAWGTDRAGIGERVNVPPSTLENLQVGDAWLRSPSTLEHVRVALPKRRDVLTNPERAIVKAQGPRIVSEVPGDRGDTKGTASSAPGGHSAGDSDVGALRLSPSEPPDKRIRRYAERIGVHWVWKADAPVNATTGYPRLKVGGRQGQYEYVHILWWEHVNGPRPVGEDGELLTVDHTCEYGKRCVWPGCKRLLTRGGNSQDRWAREWGDTSLRPEGHTTGARRVAIALYQAIGKPAVEPRTVSLDELAAMLSRFEVLADKRRGRCWSPTKYADGASSRGNAGVEAVSCMVFDCDRVPPDPERLKSVYWLAHTTHSHTPQAPRWRVVIPLARPVPAKQWADVWRRARAALCPEADPVCKDASRAYWLPSMRQGGAHEATHHPGPLLDTRKLPELPPEPKRPELRRSPTAKVVHDATEQDRRRGDAYMVRVLGNLASAAPGGRNAALNAAAWTLGRWVAAGALEQAVVEDALYTAAERNGLVADDGQRQCWATIRSGLGAGLAQPIDLDTDRRKRRAA